MSLKHLLSGHWFQRTFPNPETSERYVRNRPPPQTWLGKEVIYKKTSQKRTGLLIGQVEKRKTKK
jgi:hypothetical protein